jgi:hypothetical protein
MNVLRTSSLFAVVMFLTACVTINIYFPAAQAEEAAREMVKDILGTEEAAPAEDKESALKRPLFVMVGEGVLNFLIPPAHAAEPDFNVNTPEIRKLQAKMKQRMAGMKGYFASGAIGFTRDALVAFHDQKAVPLKERARVKKMIDAENGDRHNLYKAIARANGHPEWEKDVRKTYAKIWVDEAAKGWWYQNPKGNWKQK